MTIDPIKFIRNKAKEWEHIGVAESALTQCAEQLEDAATSEYVGAMYRTDYIVEGVGAFPIDMLRYTQSWPKGEHDVNVILACIIADDRHDGYVNPQRVTLTKIHRDPVPTLEATRWESKFRWRVVFDSVETVSL